MMQKVQQSLNLVALGSCKPILKWAGGKSQLLDKLHTYIPKTYNKYIEPFFGGGALFFNLCPEKAIIADLNPELTNLYTQVAYHLDTVIAHLEQYENSEAFFYKIRALDIEKLSLAERAARTLYLNKTCFNGLYRVNKTGQFNVPYGRYKNPKIVDYDNLYHASLLLQQATIINGHYQTVLAQYAEPNDLVFLDPPYLPISDYSDFKRYTKEQFYENDHIALATEVERLHELGCHIILTNSNHPLVHQLFGKFNIDIYSTRRHISCKTDTRTGEDVIVNIPPKKKLVLSPAPTSAANQIEKYPSTRYMGSKNKLLQQIWGVASQFEFNSVLDLFSGSGVVSYLFKAQGKQVISNDYMTFSALYTKAMVENNSTTLTTQDITALFVSNDEADTFVQSTFKDLYFTDEENLLIDQVRANIKALENPTKQTIATTALIRACFKKRPRGIFTYVGHRYDDGRKDLQTSLKEHILNAINEINAAVFDNGQMNQSINLDAMLVDLTADLVYIDPPYYSPHSDNEYVRRYHFVEGIARDWQGVEIQQYTKTKKFKSYPTPFSSKMGAHQAFDELFNKHKDSILLVSYSSNSLPTLDEMVSLLSKYKNNVEVVPIDYKYSMGNQGHKKGDNNNSVQEYLFVGF